MNLEANKERIDEIIFPNDSTMIMQKVNAQIVEFNPQGTLVAIGCKYASILIMDFMTKEMVRCFSLYDDYDLETNLDVDQFSHFRRVNYAYLEDDFVLIQKPQDEKENDSLVKREYKKIIQFEPKDKSKCKAQIASIDWSLDSRFIVVSFKVENQVVVWNIENCQKVFHQTAQQLNCQTIYSAKFYSLNPNYILISGDKALLTYVSHQNEQVLIAENSQLHQQELIKLDASPSQQQIAKRKGPKFSTYILHTLVNQGQVYFLVISNTHKVIQILKPYSKEEQSQDLPQKQQVQDFFHIHQKINKGQDEEMKEKGSPNKQKEYELSKEYDNQLYDDDLDVILSDDVDHINEAIVSINHKKFKIVSMIKFQTSNSFVQHYSVNETSTHLLLTCSDRVLRLYEINYGKLGQRKKAITLINEFQDVINRRKWMNTSFLKLNPNTKIVELVSSQSKSDVVQQIINDSKQMLFTQQQQQQANSQNTNTQEKHELQQQEIFVSSIGESGSNELKFYNVHDFYNIQRLELTQEGCSYLTAHSKAHFSIIMVTTNGSLFLWSVRPAKIIQPLAPFFNEIEDNQEYVEKENEFEEEVSDDEGIEDKNLDYNEDQIRQMKLAKTNIDIEAIDPYHLKNTTQITALKNQKHNSLEYLFDKAIANQDYQCHIITYLPSIVSNNDTYGMLAKHNVDTFREKFRKMFNHS